VFRRASLRSARNSWASGVGSSVSRGDRGPKSEWPTAIPGTGKREALFDGVGKRDASQASSVARSVYTSPALVMMVEALGRATRRGCFWA
jgi:hypothetical protein